MVLDRFEVYTQLMGGRHNLPQRLPPKSPTAQPTTSDSDKDDEEPELNNNIVDAFGNLQTYDSFVVTPFPAPPAPAYDNRHINSRLSRSQGENDTVTDFTLDSRKGEPSAIGMNFCPFLAVTKFPYKYVEGSFRQPIATAFFDEGKIYNRSWDLYYAWSDHADKAIAFVTLAQAQTLVDEVNGAFSELQWQFEPSHEQEGLLITFEDPNPNHRPRFLGTSNSRDKYDFILQSVLPGDQSQMDPDGDDTSLAAYKEKVALAAEASRNKSKKVKQERLEKNIVHRQNMGKELLQAQRHLGLLPSQPGALPPTSFDANKIAPHPREMDAIIISIDVEAYEKARGIITEVGVSTLDTRDLQGTAPGENGQNWQQFIRGRHFRIVEHKNYVNGEYVAGCPDKFDFGTSEWVSLKDMPSVLTQCFHEPFSKPAPASSDEDLNHRRNLVLLGHDIKEDIQYCHKLGFSVLGRGNLIGILDTKNLYQSFTRDPSPRGLGSIMNDFDFASWHLHNGGNDAVYTMWALLATCVRDAAERGTEESKKKHEERAKDKLESAIEAAKGRAEDDSKGWDLGEGEGGGVPIAQPYSGSGHYTLGGEPLDL